MAKEKKFGAKEFCKYCKKYNINKKDLPAFPPKLTEKEWKKLIRAISKAKENDGSGDWFVK